MGLAAVITFGLPGGLSAQAGACRPERSVQERLEDLEAYVNNGARNASTNAASKIPGPGPGHNGWMMTCAALVLFMTLPGLALFYGGLVRRKNVLSVLAQCLGIAGLVTILWWLCGYSLAFHSGETARGWSFFGKLDWAFLQRRGFGAEHRLRRLGLAQRLLDVPADVRHHHAGADHRRHRRAHEVLRHPALRHPLDVRGLFPAGPHGLGRRRPDEWRLECQSANQGHRLRRRHRRAHVLRLVGADPLPDPGQAPRLRQRTHAAAQHGALHGRHRHAVGRLVRLQRRQRRGAPTASPPTPS